MKKFLFALCGLLFTFNANAGQMANVEYIHQLIKQEHGIDIKYSPDLISPRQAANMKYLLTAVDVANEILNGEKTTDYGNGEFATRVAVDTTATIQAVRTLIKQDYKFFITTTPDTTEFSFKIQASGEFMVDWGDGKTEKIVKNDTSQQTYSHTYDTADEYKIGLDGQATGYTTGGPYPSTGFSTLYFPTASNITKIDGSLGEIFGTLPDGTNPLFIYTFQNAQFTTIPETLFHGITTESKSQFAYYGMFSGSELSTIPEKLFTHTNRFSFQGMFAGCTKLTSIPEKLFAGINAPAEYMFYSTFDSCSGLTSIPENLFAGVSVAPASYMFYMTFNGCSGLTGSIPENLFAGIEGAPAYYMFNSTFYGCSGLTGSIPENLFAGVSGAPAYYMFNSTFYGCSGLSGSIPENLFAGITGAPASDMFGYTFYGCSGLTGNIPENLFAGITGAPASYMFEYTFSGCSGLSGYIPPELFAGINTDTTASNQMSNVFNGTGLDTVCPSGTVQYTTGFESWFDGHVSCEPFVFEPKFTATTTTNTTTFSFDISAAGRFLVDWGDGSDIQVITRTSTSYETYTHTYTTAGEYQIKIDGKATGYSDSIAISFAGNTNLATIDGSLGKIFSTLSDGTNPTFGTPSVTKSLFFECTNLTSIPESLFTGISGAPSYYMFAYIFYGCTSLTSIPENLFAGIKGAPAEYMFSNTFSGCSGLSGNIPENLFAGIKGAPAEWMFSGTFSGCSGLTGNIPENLFAGVEGTPASGMFTSTFSGCSGLSGSIPENLFAGVEGTPASGMFQNTFSGCSGLTGNIPENLFAGITGAPAEYMFRNTFSGCSGLTGYIPPKLFAGIGTDTTATDQMSSVFSGTGLDRTCPSGTIQYITGFESWFDVRVSCEPYVPNATLTTTTNPGRFMIRMTAIGNFTIDWGDGNVEKITRHDTNDTEYWHDYGNADQSYSIKITGRATGYSDDPYRAAISFRENTQLAYVNGELGEIFPTLDDGTQPGFYETFYGCTGMTEISPTLFAGISGAPRARMFGSTFRKCSSLTEIPENLFAGISGAPAANVFDATFQECYNLTTIPENLFGGIYGTPAPEMFMRTFHNCSRLTSIPENLFGNISGTSANNMFNNMFEGCSNLTGYSARINGEFLYNIWPNIQTWAYVGCNKLTDYSTMPNSWK